MSLVWMLLSRFFFRCIEKQSSCGCALEHLESSGTKIMVRELIGCSHANEVTVKQDDPRDELHWVFLTLTLFLF